MLHVACVRWGAKFGVEYVERLHDMVRRNLQEGFRGRFVCFTDRPEELKHLAGVETRPLPAGAHGWWAKAELFNPAAFPEGDQVLYFDLDTVITGPLDAIAAWSGAFAILRDIYRPHGWQSSVLGFTAGTPLMVSLYAALVAALAAHGAEISKLYPGGDQEFIEKFWAGTLPVLVKGRPWPPALWQDEFPRAFASYKVEATEGPPQGCSVVFFHGYPRPHELVGTDSWVNEVWKVGGGTSAQLVQVGNVPQDVLLANAASAHADPAIDWLEVSAAHTQRAIIIGGGPSLETSLAQIAAMAAGGAIILATNNTLGYLADKGITAHAHVVLDAKPENVAWYRPGGKKLYASIVDPALRAAAQADPEAELTMWDPITPGLPEMLPPDVPLIGGGSTVGLRTMALAFAMGFRELVLFGFDSCYTDAAHHAYPQPQNDGQKVLDVVAFGKRFRAAAWMCKQAEEFRQIACELLNNGASLYVFGEGLIPWLAKHLTVSAADERAQAILERLPTYGPLLGAEIGVYKGALSSKLLARADVRLLMIDSWATEHSPAYKATDDFHTKLAAEEQAAAKAIATEVTKFAEDRRAILQVDSVAAAREMLDGTLDFVFIDADHSYEGCAADIRAWMPKVKKGGLLCGHDYENPEFPAFGVKRAVDELLGQVELGANYTWFKRIA